MKRVAIGFIVGALLLALAVGTSVAKKNDVTIQAQVLCESTDPICMGGPGPDDLFGTDGNDEIWAGDGNDRVFAFGGEDTVFGQKGNDLIRGGTGNDPRLEGNAGDDDVYGEAGNDTVSGNDGNDDLSGGSGSDILAGGEGRDAIDASGDSTGEEDSVFGGPDRDVIYAQDGVKDTIQCGSGFDTVAADAIDVVADDCEEVSTTPITKANFFGPDRFKLT